ncbi:MAG TPA: hypothetical protein VHU40_05890 [Polyangia bacterium]|jgi:hypothetical protein|nr:hypothetical protein [Polyangia bacterium]
MRTSAVVLTMGCLTFGLGCGSSDSGAPLDCAWLAGNNCYKTTVAQATSCLPPAAERGVLDANNSTCTYASGAVVTFTPPLVFPMPFDDDNKQWNFTVSKGGQPCLHYQENQAGFSLTVGADTVSEGYAGGLGLKLTCPGGKVYSNGNAFALLSCGGDDGGSFFGGLPGSTWSSSDTSVSFGLIGTSDASSTPVFDCARP